MNFNWLFLLFFLGLSLNLSGQDLKSLDEFERTELELNFLIVFGFPSCSDCYREVFSWLKNDYGEQQVYALGINSRNSLVRRNQLNHILELIDIDKGRIYFTENLKIYNDTVSDELYPKLLILYPDSTFRVYQYKELYVGENIDKTIIDK